MENNPLHIEVMSRALSYLNGLPSSMQNTEFSDIVKRMTDYLNRYCKHSIVEDDVDLTPESSKRIYYCELCMQTFDQPAN
jgi:hypothetical protein